MYMGNNEEAKILPIYSALHYMCIEHYFNGICYFLIWLSIYVCMTSDD